MHHIIHRRRSFADERTPNPTQPNPNSSQALFPDNAYAVDSGGDPLDIPNLTFDQFRSFHQAYYHPTNSRVGFGLWSMRCDGGKQDAFY